MGARRSACSSSAPRAATRSARWRGTSAPRITINYRTEDFAARVKEITGGKGVKVVYDSVGKDTWDKSLDCLRPFGLMASFGNASGAVPPFALGILAAKGSLYVTRPTLFTHIATREATQAMADELFAVVDSGKVKIRIDQRYALADVAAGAPRPRGAQDHRLERADPLIEKPTEKHADAVRKPGVGLGLDRGGARRGGRRP